MVQGASSIRRLAEASRIWEESICPFVEHFRKISETITSVDNTDPLNPICTVSSASGLYLEDGGTVTILGVDYTATSVTGTTFTVNVATSGLGLTFVNQEAIWKPLDKVQATLPEIKVGFA